MNAKVEKYIDHEFMKRQTEKQGKFYLERDEKGNIIRKVEIKDPAEPTAINPIFKI